MNKAEAIAHLQQETLEPVLQDHLSSLRVYIMEHQNSLIQSFVESMRQLCLKAELAQQELGKEPISILHCSMLRTSILEGSYICLLEAYSDQWYWDEVECLHTYDATWAFQSLSSLEEFLHIEMRRYGGVLNASDAERMMLQSAGRFNAYVTAIVRLAVPHMLNLKEMERLHRGDQFQIRVGEYKDWSEPVYVRDYRYRDIQNIRKKLTLAEGLECAYADYTSLSLTEGLFDHVDIRYSDFSLADLSKSDLRGAVLIGTKWEQSDLSGADLRGALLMDAVFRECSLRGANLSDVSDGASMEFHEGALGLQGICFAGANLEGADLRGAQLFHADFQGARLSQAQIWLHDRERYTHVLSEEQIESIRWVVSHEKEEEL